MKERFYLVYNTADALHITHYYDSKEEAELNKEFLERYFNIPVRLKIDEQGYFN